MTNSEHNPAVAVGTRFWAKTPTDLERLEVFLEGSQAAAEHTFVAINYSEDKCDTAGFLESRGTNSITGLSLCDWGKFATPLNALLSSASYAGYDQLLMASVEFPPSDKQIRYLQRFMTARVVQIGAALEDHDYRAGELVKHANARQVPWNTFSLVNVRELAKLGIPLIADGGEQPLMAGMEEVATLACQYALFGNTSSLVKIPGINKWPNTKGWTADRRAAHHTKIMSKIERATFQLERLGLDAPPVNHEVCHVADPQYADIIDDKVL